MLVRVVILEVVLAFQGQCKYNEGSIDLYLTDTPEHSLTDAALLWLDRAPSQGLHPPDCVLQVDVVVVGHVKQNVLKLGHSEVTPLIAAFYQTFIAKNENSPLKILMGGQTNLYFAWSSRSRGRGKSLLQLAQFSSFNKKPLLSWRSYLVAEKGLFGEFHWI